MIFGRDIIWLFCLWNSKLNEQIRFINNKIYEYHNVLYYDSMSFYIWVFVHTVVQNYYIISGTHMRYSYMVVWSIVCGSKKSSTHCTVHVWDIQPIWWAFFRGFFTKQLTWETGYRFANFPTPDTHTVDLQKFLHIHTVLLGYWLFKKENHVMSLSFTVKLLVILQGYRARMCLPLLCLCRPFRILKDVCVRTFPLFMEGFTGFLKEPLEAPPPPRLKIRLLALCLPLYF